VVIGLGSTILYSQRYYGLSVDNDLYFGIDRYYSSGIFLKYGKVKKQSSVDSLNTEKYSSAHWTLGQEINTPSLRLTSTLDKIDYPYSGWLYLGYEKEFLKHLDFGYSWAIKAGTTGAEASLAKFFQNTYHRYILNLEPLTWAYSIPQSGHLNFETSLIWGKFLSKKFKWVQENRIRFGTFRTALQTRFGFQWGTLEGLPFFGQRFEQLQNGISFFLGTTLTLNLHDYSLSGSLFNPNSFYTLQAEPTRNNLQVGLLLSHIPWRIMILGNSSSKLISQQRISRHPFLNISVSKVF
jgi:hypothetical protein